MPRQNTRSSTATAQNAATDPQPPNDRAVDQNAAVRGEPRSYVAADYRDASVAAPAAGEMADYMDEGEPLDTDVGRQRRQRQPTHRHGGAVQAGAEGNPRQSPTPSRRRLKQSNEPQHRPYGSVEVPRAGQDADIAGMAVRRMARVLGVDGPVRAGHLDIGVVVL